MYLYMGGKTFLFWVSFVTLRALIWFFSSMCSEMNAADDDHDSAAAATAAASAATVAVASSAAAAATEINLPSFTSTAA